MEKPWADEAATAEVARTGIKLERSDLAVLLEREIVWPSSSSRN
jgi:hypothetical protein